MRTPFKITFKEEITGTPNKTVLENFKANFSNTFYDHIAINEDKELFVKNDSFRYKPGEVWNLWLGIRNARVTINENADNKKKTVEYSFDFTRLIFLDIFLIILFPIQFKIMGLLNHQTYIALIIYLDLFFVLVPFILVLRHRWIFKRTLKFGAVDYYNGNYDWDTIIKEKTDLELHEIINGQRQLPRTVVGQAKTELERKSKHK
jgi:hypothetical protein